MTGSNPYGRAIRDFHVGEQTEPLLDICGEETREHPIERFYFGEYSGDDWLESWLEGPLLDVGAGVGQHALYFQERFETVAIEVSDHLVQTMRERGVEDARKADMFALRESFERDRFRSAFAHGTQLGLAGSMDGLRQFLTDLAYVTDDEATAVLDGNDPDHENAPEILGYKPDPTPGLAYRVYHFEYEDDVSEPLLFRLFSPDRVREATVGTDWEVPEIKRGPDGHGQHYRAVFSKR
ncbi:methyltransferase domain-containing protein [Halorussus halophilus]|uniref:class I SAM-dependent methyltransferase n=1 Tax=Halorussus halophilus TaxID=2650975 RepID=UPI0013016A17|nr:class I SAM-dependent methyltransferase [Halorussus halophilus]